MRCVEEFFFLFLSSVDSQEDQKEKRYGDDSFHANPLGMEIRTRAPPPRDSEFMFSQKTRPLRCGESGSGKSGNVMSFACQDFEVQSSSRIGLNGGASCPFSALPNTPQADVFLGGWGFPKAMYTRYSGSPSCRLWDKICGSFCSWATGSKRVLKEMPQFHIDPDLNLT